MAQSSKAPSHIVESKKELAINKAKQADENEPAEFTMSVATWCAARGALFAIAGHLSRDHVFWTSSRKVFPKVALTTLEGLSWEARWRYMCVQEFNDATKCGPYCDLFFLHVKRRQEARVSTEGLFCSFPLAWLASAGNPFFSHEPK